jgi:hypothetical protein
MQRRTRPHGHAWRRPLELFAFYAGFTGGRQTSLTWLTTYAASQLSEYFAEELNAEELNTVTLKMRVIPEAVRSRRRILVRRGSDGHGTMSIHAVPCQHDDNSDPAGLGLFYTRGRGYCSPRSDAMDGALNKLRQRLSSLELA